MSAKVSRGEHHCAGITQRGDLATLRARCAPPPEIRTAGSTAHPRRAVSQSNTTHKDVRIALSFSNVMSAEVPVLLTLTSLPQNEKKSCSLSSVDSGARPAT